MPRQSQTNEQHIQTPVDPRTVCPCQLSGHSCQSNSKPNLTVEGEPMCARAQVCTNPVCHLLFSNWLNMLTWYSYAYGAQQTGAVRNNARPKCGMYKPRAAPCPQSETVKCRFGHDNARLGENWRQWMANGSSTKLQAAAHLDIFRSMPRM